MKKAKFQGYKFDNGMLWLYDLRTLVIGHTACPVLRIIILGCARLARMGRGKKKREGGGREREGGERRGVLLSE